MANHRELDGARLADLQLAHSAASAFAAGSESRQIEIGDADFPGHQLVQQGLEQLFEQRALALVEVDLVVDGVEDCDDLLLLVESSAHGILNVSISSRLSVIVPWADGTIRESRRSLAQ